ncbi:MAG TPA: NAD-dependent epimerase/dehydratase family protein [Crenalkalicoccus sp.]|jgi:nucleoside-diphosphate-sugar epimerase|nr:NAD-dependent epimerase/dehydratase family protein [Crenalkalicoccus sp.]
MLQASEGSSVASSIGRGTPVVVTGATGFIGGRLVERLAADGCDVTCLIRGMDAGTRLHRAGARIRSLNLTDAEAVAASLQGAEIVFHLAYDWEDTAWNYHALHALIEACRSAGCRRLVYVSSFVVYDIPPEGEVSEDSLRSTATDGYAHTKLELEAEVLKAVREKGVPATIIQPTIVYGPFSKPWTDVPADMLRYGTVVLPDAGDGICNAVYVDDVVSAMILAAVRPEAVGQRYLVSGPPITWKQFYEGIARAIGAKGPQCWPVAKIASASSKAGKLRRLVTDPEDAVRRIALARRLVKVGLLFLRGGAGRAVRNRLFGPIAQWRGEHVPDPGRLNFLRSRARIESTKARRELGYAPAFSFDDGMLPTAKYLNEHHFRTD